jgi:hypothetical protein
MSGVVPVVANTDQLVFATTGATLHWSSTVSMKLELPYPAGSQM